MNNFTVTGAKIWRDERASFPKYSISISGKDKDGNFVKPAQYIQTRLPKDLPVLNSGATADLSGFLSTRGFTTKDGKAASILEFVVTKVDNLQGTAVVEDEELNEAGFQAAIDDIPF